MPYFANTPESLVSRSDSKNPSTTCRGITSSGRPCRRPIAASDTAPSTPPRKPAKLRVDDPRDEKLYCWQHKEQASLSARSSPGPRASNTPILEERTSLDTLADRLGIIQAQTQSGRPQKKPGLPIASQGGNQPQRPTKMTRPKPKKEVQFCFCFRIPIEEVSPPPRPHPRPMQPPLATPPHRIGVNGKKPSNNHLSPSPSPARPLGSGLSVGQSPGRNSNHSSAHSVSSQTAQYLSLIPTSASPQTASNLMAELAKPTSLQDEPGYIYIFWLTPESQGLAPPAEAARSLLTPPVSTRGAGQRRASDVVASFAAASTTRSHDSGYSPGKASGRSTKKKQVLLKIGRATNVQRRLNEWQRQCGYNLSLLRWYPYVSSTAGLVVDAEPKKTPHSHKVERLIHLELGGLGLRVADREKCTACGREHREWFEVEATRSGIAGVDEVVRRWVEWDQQAASR